MKKFIVDTGDKTYIVEANTYDEAVSVVKAIQLKDAGYTYKKGDNVYFNSMGEKTLVTILERVPSGDPRVSGAKGEFYLIQLPYGFKKVTSVLNLSDAAHSAKDVADEASALQTVNALLEDERAAVDAYNVALENFKGKIPDNSYAAIEAIRDDENRHIENLQAVVNGTVTEKNLEDSMKDAGNFAVAMSKSSSQYDGRHRFLGNGGRSWVQGGSNRVDLFNTREEAEKRAKAQLPKYKASVVSAEVAVRDFGSTVSDADLGDISHDADYLWTVARGETARRIANSVLGDVFNKISNPTREQRVEAAKKEGATAVSAAWTKYKSDLQREIAKRLSDGDKAMKAIISAIRKGEF